MANQSRQIMRKWRKYRPEDIEFIRKHYPKKGARYVAKSLKRTVVAITARASALGIRRQRVYSRQEDTILRGHINPRMSHDGYLDAAEKVARMLDREGKSIRNHAHILGIAPLMHPPWTSRQSAFVQKNFKRMTYAEIGRRIGKRDYTIAQHLYKQTKERKAPKHRWTPEEVQELHRLDRLGWKQRKIGEKFGVTWKAIEQKLHAEERAVTRKLKYEAAKRERLRMERRGR